MTKRLQGVTQAYAIWEKRGTHGNRGESLAEVAISDDFELLKLEGEEADALKPYLVQILEAFPLERVVAASDAFIGGSAAEQLGMAEVALAYQERASLLLERERQSLHDFRQRGTVIESMPYLPYIVARLNGVLGDRNGAFAALETFRARGLGELTAAFEAQRLGAHERLWIAEVIKAQSQESDILGRFVETAALEDDADVEATLKELEAPRERLQALLDDPGAAAILPALEPGQMAAVGLAEMESLVARTGVPVVFFWADSSETLIWAIGRTGSEIKRVSLNRVALENKVAATDVAVRRRGQPDEPFAAADIARQLHAHLIQPVEHLLDGEEVVIVPQGPLVTLPFEVLIDPRTGRYLAQDYAVSYAPNAVLAARALEQEPVILDKVVAIYDRTVESSSGEIAQLEAMLPAVATVEAGEHSKAKVLEALGGEGTVHVLLHGTFEPREPLRSFLSLSPVDASEANRITAGEMLAANWTDRRLAVFSSCEGARVNTRISNEIYGLSWAPLAGGADAVVMNRWRVEPEASAKWMGRFYKGLLAAPSSPAVAAAGAMRVMIDAGVHPHRWAAPRVIGR